MPDTVTFIQATTHFYLPWLNESWMQQGNVGPVNELILGLQSIKRELLKIQ